VTRAPFGRLDREVRSAWQRGVTSDPPVPPGDAVEGTILGVKVVLLFREGILAKPNALGSFTPP
jgi:hypothetical protein